MSETQTTHKPLPCPFCGGEKIAIAEGSTYRWAHAECGECGAAAGDIRRQYGQGTDTPEVQEAAIAEWNTRDRREIDAKDKRIAELEAQLSEARANLRHAAIRIDGFMAAENDAEAEVTQLKPYALARDEARAEADRLRPAAEAWEALQAAYQGHGSSLEYAYSLACVKRAGIVNARAAKEAKP